MSADDDAQPRSRAQRADQQAVEIYDTTLRDGSQLEGISLTVEDKLRIAEQLDYLGVDYIEAGWPGANPKDDELFRRAPAELQLATSTLVAFGSTRRVKGKVDSDDTLRHLVEANVGTVCIVGKSWDYHVLEALGTTLDEGVAMVRDSVEFLRGAGMDVLFDAEHFFDGYARNPEFALRVLEGAVRSGRVPPRAVRHQRRCAPARCRTDRRRGRRLLRERRRRRGAPARRRRHRCRQRARGCPRRRGPGAGHDQRLRRAHRELQPHDDHPEPHAEDGDRDDPARPARPADAGRAPHRRARQHAAERAGAVRRALGVRAQGRAAHERDREATRRVRARRSPMSSATAPASSSRSWPGGRRSC